MDPPPSPIDSGMVTPMHNNTAIIASTALPSSSKMVLLNSKFKFLSTSNYCTRKF